MLMIKPLLNPWAFGEHPLQHGDNSTIPVSLLHYFTSLEIFFDFCLQSLKLLFSSCSIKCATSLPCLFYFIVLPSFSLFLLGCGICWEHSMKVLAPTETRNVKHTGCCSKGKDVKPILPSTMMRIGSD